MARIRQNGISSASWLILLLEWHQHPAPEPASPTRGSLRYVPPARVGWAVQVPGLTQEGNIWGGRLFTEHLTRAKAASWSLDIHSWGHQTGPKHLTFHLDTQCYSFNGQFSISLPVTHF